MYRNLTKRKLRIEREIPLATNKHQDPFEHPERLPDLHDRGEWFVRAESSMHRPNGRWKRPAPQNFPVSFLRAIVCKTQFDSHDHQPRNGHQRILPPYVAERIGSPVNSIPTHSNIERSLLDKFPVRDDRRRIASRDGVMISVQVDATKRRRAVSHGPSSLRHRMRRSSASCFTRPSHNVPPNSR